MNQTSQGDDLRSTAAETRRKRLVGAVVVVLVLLLVALLAVWVGQTQAKEPAAGPTPSTPPVSTTVALVTDFGNCDEGEAQVAAMVDAWDPEAIASAGDNTQGLEDCVPYTDSVDDYYSDYTRDPSGPRFWPALGNHDIENEGSGLAVYRDYFTYLPTDADPQGRWYDKTLGSVHFFVLDSEASDADLAAQRVWLKGALATARAEEPATWNIVMFHRPAHSSGTHGEFAPLRESSGWDYQAWGADIVVAGHQHIYEDVLVDGLHHVTAGVGASDIARTCPTTRVAGSRVCLDGPGAMRLTATPATLILEYHQPVDGSDEVTDVITLDR